jgi:NADH dehydrogenase FAD-containing subunit
MGSSNVTPNIDPNLSKRVVIVGFSFAGQQVIQNIAKLDKNKVCQFTVIDKSDHFEHMPNNFQSFTDPDVFLKQNTISFEKMAAGFSHMLDGRLEFKQARLTEVLHEENKIEVCHPDGEKTETVDYDVLCICTGASYVGAWRGDSDKCDTLQQRNDEFAQVRDAIAAAKSVLCIGAGDTGLETAGWLKEQYPDKGVGISMRGETILKGVKGAHKVAEKILRGMDIQIHYNEAYSAGTSVMYNKDNNEEYGYYLDCSGLKFKGPTEFFKNSLDFLDKKSNQILVDKKGRVTNVHPIATQGGNQTAVVLKNVFSCGDVCLTPANEVKSIVSMYQYLPAIAINMLNCACDQQPVAEIPSEFHLLQMIPIGTKNGLMIFNNMVGEDKKIWPQKCEIRDMQIGALNGEQKWLEKAQKNAETMPKIFGVASSGCCCCMPIHISKSRKATQELQKKQIEEFDNIYKN